MLKYGACLVVGDLVVKYRGGVWFFCGLSYGSGCNCGDSVGRVDSGLSGGDGRIDGGNRAIGDGD